MIELLVLIINICELIDVHLPNLNIIICKSVIVPVRGRAMAKQLGIIYKRGNFEGDIRILLSALYDEALILDLRFCGPEQNHLTTGTGGRPGG